MRFALTVAAASAVVASFVLTQGCKSSEGAASPVQAQIAKGAEVFGANCAKCHGDAGQGGEKAPPVVGSGALPLDPRAGQKRTVKFKTALDVATFATQNMPPDAEARKKLTADDYWAVLAFDLNANGIKLTEPLSPSNAATFVLHP